MLDYIGLGRRFQGKFIRGHLDVPTPVRTRWSEMCQAEKVLAEISEELRQINYSSSWSSKQAEARQDRAKQLVKQQSQIERAYRLTFCLDDAFARYWIGYLEMRSEVMSNPHMLHLPGGESIAEIEVLYNELRLQVIEAIRRIRGKASGREFRHDIWD